eukprot:2197444-Rhodomonas_salina.2
MTIGCPFARQALHLSSRERGQQLQEYRQFDMQHESHLQKSSHAERAAAQRNGRSADSLKSAESRQTTMSDRRGPFLTKDGGRK